MPGSLSAAESAHPPRQDLAELFSMEMIPILTSLRFTSQNDP